MDINNFYTSIERLFNKGVRYSTVIDVGCADGSFFLDLFIAGVLPGAVPLNIDSNRLYEPSLSAIKDIVGGDYRICAIADRVGEIEVVEAVHPYWSSTMPEDDPYWSRVNGLVKAKVKVPALTLDALAKELGLTPPFLLKIDVQGAERSVLGGACDVLANTYVIICEADIADFQGINTILADIGFVLYDLTGIERLLDGTLGWFHPVYINKKLDHVRPSAFWDPSNNEAIIRLQVERRKNILQSNSEKLDRLRYRYAKVGRNEPCPCGSGRKFKHCCGRYGA